MTRDETKKMLFAIQTMFPSWKAPDLTLAIDTWHSVVGDMDYKLMMDALVVYIRTNTSGFAPTAGQLINLIARESVYEIDEGVIRSMLTRASRNANYGSVTEFNKLPTELQKAVGSPSVIKRWGTCEPHDLEYEFDRIIKTYQRDLSESRKHFSVPISLDVNERGALNDNTRNGNIAIEDNRPLSSV